jgi:hypothetical protein
MSQNKVKLPELSEGQEWVCSDGCGPCTPKEVDFVLQEVRDGSELEVYDNNLEKTVSRCFVETQVGPTRRVHSIGIIGKSNLHA